MAQNPAEQLIRRLATDPAFRELLKSLDPVARRALLDASGFRGVTPEWIHSIAHATFKTLTTSDSPSVLEPDAIEAVTAAATSAVTTSGVAASGVAASGVAASGVAASGVATSGVAASGVAAPGVAPAADATPAKDDTSKS